MPTWRQVPLSWTTLTLGTPEYSVQRRPTYFQGLCRPLLPYLPRHEWAVSLLCTPRLSDGPWGVCLQEQRLNLGVHAGAAMEKSGLEVLCPIVLWTSGASEILSSNLVFHIVTNVGEYICVYIYT